MLGFRTQMPWSSAQEESQGQLCEGAAAVVAARQGMETPLTAVAEAFEELARGMDADGGELRLAPFGDTCALVSVLFSSLGMAFRFAEIEYVTKVSARRRPVPRPRSIPFAAVSFWDFFSVFFLEPFASLAPLFRSVGQRSKFCHGDEVKSCERRLD